MTHRKNITKSDNFTQVIELSQIREQRLIEKRKNTERVFLQHLISVYSVIHQNKMIPIDLIEISENGCSFKVTHNQENLEDLKIKKSTISIRLYFTQTAYLEIKVQILNSTYLIKDRGQSIRYGCSIDKELKSYTAYQAFVRFMKIFSEYSYEDIK